jgi:hypothetical protein
MRIRFFAALVAFALAAAAAAQEAAPVAAAPAAAAPVRSAAVVEAALGQRDELLEDILGNELEAMLAGKGIKVKRRIGLPAGAEGGKPPEEQRISRLLAGVDSGGADVVVAAFYLAQDDELTFQFALYDPAVKVVLGGTLARARRGLASFSSVLDAVGAFEPAVERYVEGAYRVEAPSGLVERILVSGPQEGSRVVIVDRDFGLVSGGRLVIPYTQYPIGTTVPVSVTKQGYHAYSRNYTLDAAQAKIAAPPLRRETRVDAGLRWSLGQAAGLGFGARFHIQPDTLFLGIEAYRYIEPASLSRRLVRHYDLGASIGRYVIFPYSSFLRIHLSIGAGLVVTDVEGIPGREYVDYYVALGDPTAEIRLGPVSIFARADLHYALGAGYNLLGRQWIRTPYGLPPITLGARLSW